MNVLMMKCDVCSANIRFEPEEWTAKCPYCKKPQVRPHSQGEMLRELERANELWADCRFAEATQRYHNVIARNPDEYEARWKLMLCKYGVQYVSDEATGTTRMVCHKTLWSSLRNEAEYRHACELAPEAVRVRYEEDAAAIDRIQAEIRRLKAGEEQPWEVFISHQRFDAYGNPTPEAEVADTVDRRLTALGYRVFCPRDDRLMPGAEHEAAVQRAIGTAKVMIVIGVRREHFEATRVRSEWLRFMERPAEQEDRLILPLCRGGEAELPKELRNLSVDIVDLESEDYLARVEACLYARLRKAQEDQEKIRDMRIEQLVTRIVERIPQPRDDSLDRGIRLYREEKYEEALGPLMQAAEAGYAEAQLRLGMMYRRGRVVARDDAKAAEWFAQAAAQESTEAWYRLGLIYGDEQSSVADLPHARECFMKAAERNMAAAQYELGRLCQSDGDYDGAVRWYSLAAEQNDPAAQFKMGYLYARGLGVERDMVQAIAWYGQAAEHGLPEAQFNVGRMYHDGVGVEKNDDEAFRWYLRAARQGLVQAQNSVGACYQTGKGVGKDAEEARRWYRAAAEAGESHAQYNLARMMMAEDQAGAVQWFLEAAKQGSEKAKRQLRALGVTV